MNYCNHCGARVIEIIPPGDNRLRHVCPACGAVHYRNPKIVTGCIPEWEGRILLCRRAIEPRYGLWTLPAGFMENGETTAEGAARETLEEAGARVELGQVAQITREARDNSLFVEINDHDLVELSKQVLTFDPANSVLVVSGNALKLDDCTTRLKVARLALPPSPEYPALPVPAMVRMVPVPVTTRTQLFWSSAM